MVDVDFIVMFIFNAVYKIMEFMNHIIEIVFDLNIPCMKNYFMFH